MRLYQTNKLLYNKRKSQKNEGITYRIGQNFANDKSDKWLIFSKNVRNFKNSVAKKQITWFKNGNRHKQTFIKRRHSKGQDIYEKMFNVLTIREMQIEITKRHHLTPVQVAVIEKTKDNKCGKNVEKREPLNTIGGNINEYHYGKHYGSTSKN